VKPWQKRGATSVALAMFFLVVYGGSEAIAARRTGVPSFYFAWERHVPFVPAAIVPYLSIDLFFVAAPLLVRTDRQLRAYAGRVVAAIAVAGACFVLLPLRFAFVQPPDAGVFGVIVGLFKRADLPLNQSPSLHIALLLIVGDVFVRRARGPLRAALLVWFGLIAASPLLVYQHHLTDLIAGLALGLLCLHFIPDDPRPWFDRNGRVGLYYAVGGGALLGACVWIGRSAWPLWWPTVSLLTVAVGYAALGPALYQKVDGKLGWTSRLLLGPALLGQHASLHWYARRCRPWDAVTDRLWIGRKLTGAEATAARSAGVAAVVDLTCEFTEPRPFRTLSYLHLPTLDLTAPTQPQLDAAVAFVAEQAGIVYVHCKAGYSRAAVVVAAYLLASGGAASADEAIDLIRRARPSLIVRPEARRAIEAFALLRPQRRPDEEK
jgi:hypothetical protein